MRANGPLATPASGRRVNGPGCMLSRTLALFTLSMMVTSMTHAQAPTAAELKQRKEAAEAEKLTIDAELALEESRKKLKAATTPPDPIVAGRTEAIAAATAEKDIAAARQAKADAELAALKSTLGGLPSSGIAGTVTVGDKAGVLEMALLTAVATDKVSKRIADAVKAVPLAAPSAPLIVMTRAQLPMFQAVTAYKAQRSLVLRAMMNAVETAESEGQESFAAAGIAIESITKLLGFFRSDFSVNGSDLPVDDAALLQATLEKLLGGAYRVSAPEVYNPAAVRDMGSVIAAELAEFADPRSRAAVQAIRLEADATTNEASAANAALAEPVRKAARAKAARQKALAERLRATVTAFDTLVTRLYANDEGSNAMLRELMLFNALQRPATRILLVKMHKAAGSFYTQKNLWNALGVMPFSVAGGVVVSYTLLDGSDGTVLDAGLVPLHGGFEKIGDVRGAVNLRY